MSLVSFGKALSTAAYKPDAPAITDQHGTVTWSELDWMSSTAAYRLQDLCIEVGDFVGLTGDNTAQFLAAAFGIWKLGAIPLVIPKAKSPSETSALLQLAQPKVLIGFSGEVTNKAHRLSMAQTFATVSERPELPDVVSPSLRVGASGGSTGAAKLIVVDSPALADPDHPWPAGMVSDGVHIVPLNVTDGTGFIMSALGLVARCHLVLMPLFEPEETLRLIEQYRADWVALTPPLMLAIWKLGPDIRNKYDLSSLRAISQYSGGAPIWLKEAWIEWLGPDRLFETYGATESRGHTEISGREWVLHPGSCGRAAQGCEIAIMNADRQFLRNGEIGDIYFRDLTKRRNFRYLGAQLQSFSDGWESVGDMGWIDEEGYLYVSDRRKDAIETAAGTIFPAEIEGALERHEAIRSALVFGLPAEDGGERIHALIDAPLSNIDANVIKMFLLDYLPPSKTPGSFEFCNRPLRDTAGKARRSQYRADRMRVIGQPGSGILKVTKQNHKIPYS